MHRSCGPFCVFRRICCSSSRPHREDFTNSVCRRRISSKSHVWNTAPEPLLPVFLVHEALKGHSFPCSAIPEPLYAVFPVAVFQGNFINDSQLAPVAAVTTFDYSACKKDFCTSPFRSISVLNVPLNSTAGRWSVFRAGDDFFRIRHHFTQRRRRF